MGKGEGRERRTNGSDLLRQLEDDSLVGRSGVGRGGVLVLGESGDLRVGGGEGGAWRAAR